MNAEVLPSTPSPSAYLREAFWRMKSERVKVHPCNTTRASSLGHECERFVVLERTAWELRAPHSATSQAIFDLGNELEKYVVREIEAMGVEVIQRQRDYADRKFDLTGHTDGKIVAPGCPPAPLEIKGLNPYTAGTLHSISDIRDHKDAWVRKYYAQLQTYLFLDSSELGVFALLNKVSGQIEFIDCPLDYEFAEGLLRKAERIKHHVATGTLPPQIESAECLRCPFVHVCKPDIQMGQGATFFDDEEVKEALARREELAAARAEFDRLDRLVKSKLPKKAGDLLIGDFVARGTEVTRKAYAVEASTHTQWKFERLLKENK